MSKTTAKSQKPPAVKLENIMFNVEAGFLKRLVKYYEEDIQKPEMDLFIRKGELIISEMTSARVAMIEIVFIEGLSKKINYSISFKAYNEGKINKVDCLKDILKQFNITKANSKQKITIGIDFVKNEIGFAFVNKWTNLRVLDILVKPGEPQWPKPTVEPKVKIDLNFDVIASVLGKTKKLERIHIGVLLKDLKTKELLKKPQLIFELYSGSDRYNGYTAIQLKKIPYNKMSITKDLQELSLKKGTRIAGVFNVDQTITLLKLLQSTKGRLSFSPNMPLTAIMENEYVFSEYHLAPVMYTDSVDTCVF